MIGEQEFNVWRVRTQPAFIGQRGVPTERRHSLMVTRRGCNPQVPFDVPLSLRLTS